MNTNSTVIPVYANARKMLEYRGITVLTHELTQAQLLSQIESQHYVVVYGYRAANPTRSAISVALVVVEPNAGVSTRTQEFTKMTDSVSKTPTMVQMRKDAGTGATDNIIVIISNTLSRRGKTATDGSRSGLSTHVQKSIVKMNVIDRLVEVYDYRLFGLELPKHAASFPHTITPDEELALAIKYLHTQPEDFAKILIGDPQVVWLGARPGQVVRIERPSDNAGYAVAYRQVVESDVADLPLLDS